nr:PREDICTED: uncharacterized protein LOC102208545 [Pundamilia nyererei]
MLLFLLGFYCPLGSPAPVPCPKGTYGPHAGAVSMDSCLKCPAHHYCPRPGLYSPLSCGPVAQQPVPGQDTCICPEEGQSFQASDGRCHCTIGYQTTGNGDKCVQQQYDVCRDGKTRTQYGDCRDRHQWSFHCSQQVCHTAEDYRGFDGELGLCICREPPGRAACGGLCRSRPAAELKLQCETNGEMGLVWSYDNQMQASLASSAASQRNLSDCFLTPLNRILRAQLYVRVMPAGGQCYEPGFFFPTIPRHVTRLGISRRRNLLLRPDWLVTILFREYGWPEKEPIKARYRSLQLAYQMDDYSSKASTDASEEFWDYEHQVDLEAFNSNTFYSLLLKQSLSVTTRLGQLTTEVKELYQGVLGKLQILHPHMIAEEKPGEGYAMLRREIEREVVRRKSLASQLRTLLDSQLKVLRREQQAQWRIHSVFTSRLRECTRLLSKLYSNNQTSTELFQQILIQRLTSLVDEMGDLLSAECHRQGSWGLLGEGIGAKLLCPDTGTVLTKDDIFDDNRKWDSPLLPFIPYPTSCHSDQPLPSTHLRGLRPGQRLQLGIPMADPDKGVPVPILAVTIHPQTGLVYTLGRIHVCPLTRLPQPIQIGYPMLDSRTGNIVLTVGVSLDPITGDVLPVGGVLLGEPFVEPLSGQMVLAALFKVLNVLKPLTEEWGSDQSLQHVQTQPGSDRGSSQQDHLLTAAKELQQAWGRSLHCQLQLQTRLEILQEWSMGLQQDGETLGEMPLPGSDICVPALLGVEYPDPLGSGLSVPILGFQIDLVSGKTIPLAGTMEDPNGKGLVAIRYGSQTVDPVTGLLAPVVGARLDASRKNVVPVTSSYWLMIREQTDSVQVEALQREVCVRNGYWQQQRQREEDILTDLDSTLSQCFFRVTDVNSYQAQWSGKQLREAAMELQDSAQTEAQRRAAQHSRLALILPPLVLHILTLGQLFGKLDRELGQRELVEQCCSRQTELEATLNPLHFVRHLSLLRADTAQAVLCGKFWFKEYGLVQYSGYQPNVKIMGLLQQKALPLLERLNQLLEEKQPAGFSSNTCNQHISGISTQSFRETGNIAQSQDTGLQASSAVTHNSQRQTGSSGIHSQEEEWTRLLELSPLFQLLKGVELQLKGWASKAGLLAGELATSIRTSKHHHAPRKAISYIKAGEKPQVRLHLTTSLLNTVSNLQLQADLGKQLKFPQHIEKISLRPDMIIISEASKHLIMLELGRGDRGGQREETRKIPGTSVGVQGKELEDFL